MKPIIGLVGPSNAGKTTLIMEMLKRFPDKLAPLKSLTTRPKLEEQDDLFFEFVSEAEIKKREEEGGLVQVSEYAGNYYANNTEQTLETLKDKVGIAALVEDGVRNFERSGFNVITVKILPEGGRISDDEIRREADEARARNAIEADFEIVNSFSPGGLELAIEDLTGVIEMSLA